MISQVISFPFDLFDSGGTSEGVQLMEDAVLDMQDESRHGDPKSRTAQFASTLQHESVSLDTMEKLARWRELGKKTYQDWKDAEDTILVWLTGSHLGVLPVLDCLGSDVLVLQLDAHLDLYSHDDCKKELSHGNFLRSICKPRPRIVHIGNRDLYVPASEQTRFLDTVHSAEAIHARPQPFWDAIQKEIDDSSRIWLDIDCDFFDPSFFPGVLNPLPSGFPPAFVMQLLDRIPMDRLRGLSISEFCSAADPTMSSQRNVVWLLEWFFHRVAEVPRSGEREKAVPKKGSRKASRPGRSAEGE